MTQNRTEKSRTRKIQEALGCNYTQALRIYRDEGSVIADWSAVTPEQLREVYQDFI